MAYLGCDRMAKDMWNCNSGSTAGRDFTFAFNQSKFSDRILHIQVMPDSDVSGDGCKYNIPEDMITEGKPDKENDDMNARSCSVQTDYFNIPVRVRSIHVNSAILAEMSPFFHKLFSNGMRESEERNVTIRISLSEEVAFMDLLQFMYSGKLDAYLKTMLLDVLMVADKFQVTKCVHYCKTALHNSPESIDNALLYLTLPQSIQTVESLRSLIDAAKKFLMQELGDIKRFAEGVMMLPLEAIEVLLSSDELIVESEDALYDFVIKWARKHYPDLEKRREIFGSKLCQLVRFSNMSNQKLKEVIGSKDLDNVCASKAVLEALLLKAEVPQKRLNERAYQHLPVTVVELDAPIRQCIVFWNITKEDFIRLYFQSEKWLCSEYFRFNCEKFQLWAACVPSDVSATGKPEFQASICMNIEDDERFNPRQSSKLFFIEFAVRAKPSFEFESLSQFQSGCDMNWPYSPAFIDDDSLYFIDNIIQFRVLLTLRP